MLGKFDEILVRHNPHCVAFKTEILQAEASLRWIGNHIRTPVLEILDSAELDAGIVNVDPVVGESITIKHQSHDQEIAIIELGSRGPYFLGSRRIKTLDQL